MEKKDKLYMSIYNDYYSGLLTEYQSQLISMYYDEDLSLLEMGERLSISPQGVRDALKRAEKTLEELEAKLHLVKKSEATKSLLEKLSSKVDDNDKKEIDEVLNLLEK